MHVLYICEMKKIVLLLLLTALVACKVDDKDYTGKELIHKSIQAHGSPFLDQSTMEFKFRETQYKATRDKGMFQYSREFIQDSLRIKDVLSNNKKERYINDSLITVADSLLNGYASSLNSVVYFAQLPYSLDGDAIISKKIGIDTILNNKYYEVKVTFKEEGGGEDHDDVFVYWINKDNYLIDYLAYSYCEEECGYRFRESVNRRTVNGVIIQDYKNYKAVKTNPDLLQLDDLFEKGQLELVSEIKTEQVKLTLD